MVQQDTLEVELPSGNKLPARILAHDPQHDLAALAIEASGLPTVALGNSKDLHPGQLVLASGHPWGIAGAVCAGPVINVGRRRS